MIVISHLKLQLPVLIWILEDMTLLRKSLEVLFLLSLFWFGGLRTNFMRNTLRSWTVSIICFCFRNTKMGVFWCARSDELGLKHVIFERVRINLWSIGGDNIDFVIFLVEEEMFHFQHAMFLFLDRLPWSRFVTFMTFLEGNSFGWLYLRQIHDDIVLIIDNLLAFFHGFFIVKTKAESSSCLVVLCARIYFGVPLLFFFADNFFFVKVHNFHLFFNVYCVL